MKTFPDIDRLKATLVNHLLKDLVQSERQTEWTQPYWHALGLPREEDA
jgi:hypothetical protein